MTAKAYFQLTNKTLAGSQVKGSDKPFTFQANHSPDLQQHK